MESDSFFKIKTLTTAAFLVTAACLFGQVKGTKTDEQFANTTIVFKDSNATDIEILSNIDKSFGLSDVVRITVEPKREAEKSDSFALDTPIVSPADPTPASKIEQTEDFDIQAVAVEPVVSKNEKTSNAAPPAPRLKSSGSSTKKASVKKSGSKKSGGFSLGRKTPKQRKPGKQKLGCYKF